MTHTPDILREVKNARSQMRSWVSAGAGCSVLAALFGGVGVFCVLLSFAEPMLGGYGLVLLVSATGLLLAGEE